MVGTMGCREYYRNLYYTAIRGIITLAVGVVFATLFIGQGKRYDTYAGGQRVGRQECGLIWGGGRGGGMQMVVCIGMQVPPVAPAANGTCSICLPRVQGLHSWAGHIVRDDGWGEAGCSMAQWGGAPHSLAGGLS